MHYKTTSGSTYEVQNYFAGGGKVRQLERSEACRTNRISGEWREFERMDWGGIGNSIVFTWGFGTDEFSDRAQQIGTTGADDPDAVRLRVTQTTPVVWVGMYLESAGIP